MGVRQRGDPEANPGYGDYDHPGYYLSPGEVCLPVAGWWDGRKVGRVLFGADLFKPRGMDEPEETSDYQLVIDRLQQRISELKCLNSGTAC